MRRRDVVYMCVGWGLFLAALMWALSTEIQWIKDAKPIEKKTNPLPQELVEEPPPPSQDATGVIGTVSDDTRDSMAKAMVRPKSTRIPPKAKTSQPRSGHAQESPGP